MALPQTTSRVPIFSRMKAGSDEARHRNTHAANMEGKSKAKTPDSFFLSFPKSAAPVINVQQITEALIQIIQEENQCFPS